jgi:hypothetical protein
METAPPCLAAIGMNKCVRALYNWQVHGTGHLAGAWVGWRIAGDELISPDGVRLSLGMVRRLEYEVWLRGGMRKRRRPAAVGRTRAQAPSGLPAPSEDGDPVALAVAILGPPLRGGTEEGRTGAGFSGK